MQSPPSNSESTHADGILVLDIVGASGGRRRLWLRPGQVVHFGRTHRADECFPEDAGMSSRHFVLEDTTDGWQCRDLKSTNGTFLNDTKIGEARVGPGDRIRAGNTTFIVVPTVRPGEIESFAMRRPQRSATGSAPLRLPGPGEFMYREYTSHSELRLMIGVKSDFDPAFVLQILAGRQPPFIVAHEAHARKYCPDAKLIPLQPPATGPDEPKRVIVANPSRVSIEALVAARWGSDELVALIGGKQKERAIECLQAMVRRLKSNAAFRPSHLADLFLNQSDPPSEFFSDVELLFSEVYGGDRWGIITTGAGRLSLPEPGFRRAEPWE